MVRLLSVEITNYQSFGDLTSISFSQGINIIVGENNVGKSAVLRAIDVCLSADRQFNESETHHGKRTDEVMVNLKILLGAAELKELVEGLLGGSIETGKLPEKLREVTVSKSGSSHTIKFGELYFLGKRTGIPSGSRALSCGFFSSQDLESGLNLLAVLREAKTPGDEALRAALDAPSKSWKDSFFASEGATVNPPIAWKFEDDIQKLFQVKVFSKIKNLSEIRLRPGGTPYERREPGSGTHEVRESLDGSRVADVLDTLKNGNSLDQQRWQRIKEEFHELFPSLELQLSRVANKPQIFVVNRETRLEAPIDAVGAAVGQAITLLTHLIAFEGDVVGIDMPELHLHPHAQRALLTKISQFVGRTQIIVVTHSPIFVTAKYLENMMIMRMDGGNTSVSQLPVNYFTQDERWKLEQHLDIWGRDLFFSRGVLVVEGPTELGAFPIFAMFMGKDFDRLGITVSQTAGKDGFFLLLKTLRGFSIPWFAVCDRDAVEALDRSIEISSVKIKTSAIISQVFELGLLSSDDTQSVTSPSPQDKSSDKYDGEAFNKFSQMLKKHSVYVLPSDFEGVLRKRLPNDVFERAKRLPDSKVVRGRFLAEEATKRKLVPNEFQEIVSSMAAEIDTKV